MGDLLPLGLRHSLEAGNCVLFIGAGIGNHLRKAGSDQLAPDAATLARELADHFSISVRGNYVLSKIAQVVQLRKGRKELEAFLKRKLSDLEPDEHLRWFTTLRWKAIFTTNYDRGIERAYELNPTPLQKPLTISLTSDLVSFDARFEVPIYHLHGSLFGTQDPLILLTEDDYVRFREKRRMLFEILKREFFESTILYLGYGNQDPNWKIVLEEAQTEFFPSAMPPSYRLAPVTDPLDDEILEAQGIKTLDGTLADFVALASAVVTPDNLDARRIHSLQQTVPSNLAAIFDKSPAATARLLTSWVYVNQAPFDGMPNMKDFLRGDRPNWALVGQRLHFERDVEEQVLDELLDFATSAGTAPSTLAILAPAGYGISTLLMSLAARLVSERAGPVFMHKPGAPLLEGDVEFAASIFPQRGFFIVDNAADNSSAVQSAIYQLQAAHKPAFVLIGERINEWRQARGRFHSREMSLEQLSDPEILRLLACLETHSELGVLTELTPELRFSAIRQRHQKQLLVVLREATEGKAFDAILEDEYRGIADDLSRELYLHVCCFYQHGALARDTLLCDLLKRPLVEMYSLTRDSTEGVVIYEDLDASYSHHLARTRHQTIAEVVWQRCSSSAEKERILVSILNGFNLGYRADRNAFELFIKSDQLIDSIKSFDGKVRFFEVACRKDPDNPYIRQHYARMLSREDRPELALGQVEEALKIGPNTRILHHTRGVVLKQLALAIDSVELARRRLVQSEQSFRRGLTIYDRDEYCYQGLAELFLGWAKRSSDEGEIASYITKAEETIADGLRKVRVRDALWVVSAQIQQFLGNSPQHLTTLERAVRESPGSVVPRYLLGRTYRKAGRPDQAIEILYPLIRDHHNEFRSFVEYAMALVEVGEPYSKATAILQLSTLYGFGDPRFIATLGGMLFIDGKFSESDAVFAEAQKREFPSPELTKVQFRPRDRSYPARVLRMTGRIAVVKPGFAFIESQEFPKFFCPGSNFGGLPIKVGLHVSFEPAFSARGAIAEKLAAV